MKRITDIQLKEIRGGGNRKNVGTCARLIGGGAAWGAGHYGCSYRICRRSRFRY